MAPTFLNDIVARIAARSPDNNSPTSVFDKGPLVARTILLARETSTDTSSTTTIPVTGVTHVEGINNKGIFALFGLLGAAICIGIIWFFFWAKNGGFHFRENDWDDYKSTVLRRRGPNGTLLSNATASTKLGGGSVYKDVDDYTNEDGRTVLSGSTDVTESSDMTGITAGASDLGSREARRKKKEQRARERERRRAEKYNNEKAAAAAAAEAEAESALSERKRGKDKDRHKAKKEKKGRSGRKVNEEGVLVDEEAEAAAQAQLRDYRHEKAARVGGINTTGDSSIWDGSNPSHSAIGTESTVTSELMSNRESTPTNTPKKSSGNSGGIRKVYSVADRNAAREEERLRREEQRLRSEARRQERQERRDREERQDRQDRHERSKRASHSYTAALTSTSETRVERPRRDFSFKYGEDAAQPLRQIEEGSSRVDGDDDDNRTASPHMRGGYAESYAEESDLGTKSYHCFIPGLSTPGGSAVDSVPEEQDEQEYTYAEERRKQRRERRARRQ